MISAKEAREKTEEVLQTLYEKRSIQQLENIEKQIPIQIAKGNRYINVSDLTTANKQTLLNLGYKVETGDEEYTWVSW